MIRRQAALLCIAAFSFGFLTTYSFAAKQEGQAALALAATEGHVDICKALLEAGATANHEDNDQQTALHAACAISHLELIEALLAGGLDPDHQDGVRTTCSRV